MLIGWLSSLLVAPPEPLVDAREGWIVGPRLLVLPLLALMVGLIAWSVSTRVFDRDGTFARNAAILSGLLALVIVVPLAS
ncbi:MAG: hypothetical protein KDB86_07520 [Actinobacteria bacterium]|nr:hypothetical protein [Actinomycetota bacterium]